MANMLSHDGHRPAHSDAARARSHRRSRRRARRAATALMGVAVSAIVGWARPAHAFDYLEHSFLTDRACFEAQHLLGRRLSQAAPSTKEPLLAAYLALGLVCPASWKPQYCDGGYKHARSHVNMTQGHEQPMTLGDFAALPDHVSELGEVNGLARAERSGLTSKLLEWLGPDYGDPGGVLADVAEDACEVHDLIDFGEMEREVQAGLRSRELAADVDPRFLLPTSRSTPNRGPYDPATGYSFDNPHYLDLVVQNHSHFGREAYGHWLGLHAAARGIANGTCEDLLPRNADLLETLADGLPEFEDLEWDELTAEELGTRGCALVQARVRTRLMAWLRSADPALTAPVPRDALERDATLLPRVVPQLLALVFEGAGLHFLQDSMSGGHVRVNRAAFDMERARHAHDQDGRHGVVTVLGTAAGERRFVAFGDSYLLGRVNPTPSGCDFRRLHPGQSRAEVTTCLLREHRSTLLRATIASLVDFALGGPAFDQTRPLCDSPNTRFVCEHLPTVAPDDPGHVERREPRTYLVPGTMPEPPLGFNYQSFVISAGMEVPARSSQAGLRFVFLSELGEFANWMTSYDMGLSVTFAEGGEQTILGQFATMFHYRLFARALFDAGPVAYLGVRDIGGTQAFVSGVGPAVSFSLLPEGWIHMPLQLGIGYRSRVTWVDGRRGFALRFEGHIAELMGGLAFM